MIEHIIHEKETLAILIKNRYEKKGIEFFTPSDFSQQLGYMKRPKDYIIPPHTHNKVERTINFTQEVLFVKQGKIRIDFYSSAKLYLKSRIIETGDVILLANGGHGFKMIEESVMIEVKQGPYVEQVDKVRFDTVEENNINLD